MSIRSAFYAVSFAVFAATAAQSQSSLGVNSGGIELGLTATETSDQLGFAKGWVDVKITGAHGFQLGAKLADTPAGVLGTLDAHLYLEPNAHSKYGLFSVVSDLDNAHFTMGAIGAEGMWPLGERTLVEARGGIGIAKRTTAPESLDFIFLGGGVTHEISPSLNMGVHVDLAEYDEAALRAHGYQAMAEFEYRPNSSPIVITAGVGVSDLSGRDGTRAQGIFNLGISYTFGANSTTPKDRAFRPTDAYAPLAIRGNF